MKRDGTSLELDLSLSPPDSKRRLSFPLEDDPIAQAGWSPRSVARFFFDDDEPVPAPITPELPARGNDPAGWGSTQRRGTLEEQCGISQAELEELVTANDQLFACESPQEIVTIRKPEEALGRLDFYRRYLVGINNLQATLSEQQLRELSDAPLEQVEVHLWAMLNVSKKIQPLKKPTENEASLIYSCNVDMDGRISFKNPAYEEGKMPLQRALGDDKVLQVNFCTRNRNSRAKFQKILLEGIDIGMRHYDFLVYKEDKQRKGKPKGDKSQKAVQMSRCYFVSTRSCAAADHSDLYFRDIKSLEHCRSYLMHVHTVTKLPLVNKRLQLALSKTHKADIDMSQIVVEKIEDIACKDGDGKVVRDAAGKPLIHTDGTGFISEDLARKCCEVADTEDKKRRKSNHDLSALIQVRLFYRGMAIKGTLLVNKQLHSQTLLYRDSMLKVVADPKLLCTPSYNSLEICGVSVNPKVANLSRYIIALLMLGGVPGSVFIQTVNDAIEKAEVTLHDDRAAYDYCCKRGEIAAEVKDMLLADFPLEDPYLQFSLMGLIKSQFKSYAKAKVPLEDSYYLMGSADPTGTLERNQVAILRETPLCCSKVLVYKHPGMHPGDVHVFEAIWNQELEQCLGKAKYAILFSTQGSRSIVDEIANSDLDGDMYWICTNEQVVSAFTQFHEPWQTPKPKDIDVPKVPKSSGELQKLLVQQFLKAAFYPSMAVSVSATNWLVFMDMYLQPEPIDDQRELQKRLLDLVDLYYAALDAEKTGEKVIVPFDLVATRRPQFNRDPRCRDYNSKSVFGEIDQLVNEKESSMRCNFPNGFPQPYEAFQPEFQSEEYVSYLRIWELRFADYNKEMGNAMNSNDTSSEAEAVITKYRKLLYGGSKDYHTMRNKSLFQTVSEACAIYNVVHASARQKYERQMRWSFNFAWKVADEMRPVSVSADVASSTASEVWMDADLPKTSFSASSAGPWGVGGSSRSKNLSSFRHFTIFHHILAKVAALQSSCTTTANSRPFPEEDPQNWDRGSSRNRPSRCRKTHFPGMNRHHLPCDSHPQQQRKQQRALQQQCRDPCLRSRTSSASLEQPGSATSSRPGRPADYS